MQHKFLISSIIFSICFVPVFAQNNNEDTYNENVIVTGSYKPVITMQEKINVAPTITDTASTLQHKFSYNISPIRLNSFYEPSRIKAANIIGEPRSRLYNSYIRLGLGNYWTPLLDAYYNSTTSKNLNYGAKVGHLSSWGTIGDKDVPEEYYGANHYSMTDVTLFGKYIYKDKLQFSTDLSYQSDYNLYYGFSDSTLQSHNLTRDDIRKKDYHTTYNFLSWNGGVKKIINEGVGYEAYVNVANLWATYGRNEFNLNINGAVSYRFKINRTLQPLVVLRLRIGEYDQKIAADSDHPLGYLGGNLPNEQHWQRGYYNINPYATQTLAGFNLHLGFKALVDQFTTPNDASFYMIPDITVGRNFLKDRLGLTIGAIGDATPESWNAIRLKNPYSDPFSTSKLTRHYEFFAQARYQISKKLEFNLRGSYNLWHNYLAFRLSNSYLFNNIFQPKYEDFSQFVLQGDIAFINDEILTAEIGGTYYTGSGIEPDTLPGLYHPSFDAHLNIHLNYNDKIYVHLQGLLLSKLAADFTYDTEKEKYVTTVTLPMRYGINLMVEYRYSRALSFFLKADNLAFQRYYYWQNYPSQKALFMVGLTYTIH